MTHKFKAIIFDMDGLLVASEGVWLRAETEMVAARGVVFTPQIREQLVGLRLDEFCEKLNIMLDLDDDPAALETELIQRFTAYIASEVRPQPGAAALIQYVHASRLPTAIASSSPQSVIDAVIAGQGWLDAFPVRVTADIVPRGKPAPDVYLKTADLLGVSPRDCLALEDSPNGARAAVAAGMTCFAVPDPVHSDHTCFNGITPHVFASLYQVLDQLTEA
jgi:HAD superfamily hydrolase (TIGR01509 family)